MFGQEKPDQPNAKVSSRTQAWKRKCIMWVLSYCTILLWVFRPISKMSGDYIVYYIVLYFALLKTIVWPSQGHLSTKTRPVKASLATLPETVRQLALFPHTICFVFECERALWKASERALPSSMKASREPFPAAGNLRASPALTPALYFPLLSYSFISEF